jgi:two-component system sensor histidine kinase KdpD
MQEPAPTDVPYAPRRGVWALAIWLAGALLLALLDNTLDLANLALILVLVSALAALWSSPWVAVAASALGVLAFNYALVPPRGSFTVNLHQHALLLATMLVVSGLVALLMARQRRLAAQEHRHAQESEALRLLGERLREADEPAGLAGTFRQALQQATATPATLLLQAPGSAAQVEGEANDDETAGLRLCMQQGIAMGPGTGRHEEQPAWYLPMRGRRQSHGAALLHIDPDSVNQPGLRHAQALCDQMGLALERAAALRQAAMSREAAQTQALRNTLLAAVAHDHRTPLATILGAASSLHDQADRLGPEQRRRLAATIVDEAGQLARLTENTLQLARLDTPGLELRREWESAEELIGTVLRRLRQREPSLRLRTRVEPDLPLLHCDGLLLVQLLDNLVDNARKYGGEAAPVEIVARRMGEQLLIAVRDRGPGVPAAQRERIFESFQRGALPPGSEARRGAGVGLALCRAIARAHGGELRLRPRGHGGSAFELWLPVQAPPRPPESPA